MDTENIESKKSCFSLKVDGTKQQNFFAGEDNYYNFYNSENPTDLPLISIDCCEPEKLVIFLNNQNHQFDEISQNEFFKLDISTLRIEKKGGIVFTSKDDNTKTYYKITSDSFKIKKENKYESVATFSEPFAVELPQNHLSLVNNKKTNITCKDFPVEMKSMFENVFGCKKIEIDVDSSRVGKTAKAEKDKATLFIDKNNKYVYLQQGSKLEKVNEIKYVDKNNKSSIAFSLNKTDTSKNNFFASIPVEQNKLADNISAIKDEVNSWSPDFVSPFENNVEVGINPVEKEQKTRASRFIEENIEKQATPNTAVANSTNDDDNNGVTDNNNNPTDTSTNNTNNNKQAEKPVIKDKNQDNEKQDKKEKDGHPVLKLLGPAIALTIGSYLIYASIILNVGLFAGFIGFMIFLPAISGVIKNIIPATKALGKIFGKSKDYASEKLLSRQKTKINKKSIKIAKDNLKIDWNNAFNKEYDKINAKIENRSNKLKNFGYSYEFYCEATKNPMPETEYNNLKKDLNFEIELLKEYRSELYFLSNRKLKEITQQLDASKKDLGSNDFYELIGKTNYNAATMLEDFVKETNINYAQDLTDEYQDPKTKSEITQQYCGQHFLESEGNETSKIEAKINSRQTKLDELGNNYEAHYQSNRAKILTESSYNNLKSDLSTEIDELNTYKNSLTRIAENKQREFYQNLENNSDTSKPTFDPKTLNNLTNCFKEDKFFEDAFKSGCTNTARVLTETFQTPAEKTESVKQSIDATWKKLQKQETAKTDKEIQGKQQELKLEQENNLFTNDNTSIPTDKDIADHEKKITDLNKEIEGLQSYKKHINKNINKPNTNELDAIKNTFTESSYDSEKFNQLYKDFMIKNKTEICFNKYINSHPTKIKSEYENETTPKTPKNETNQLIQTTEVNYILRD